MVNSVNPIPFIVAESNKEAYAVIRNAFKGISYDVVPILLYGQTGVGKTHLLKCMARDENSRNTKFVNATDIIEELVTKLKEIKGIINEQLEIKSYFIKKFSGYDLVVIDNLYVLTGKPATQEYFSDVVCALAEYSKKVILVTDVPLGEYKTFEERMKSRFGGLRECVIDTPDDRLKMEIIHLYAERRKIPAISALKK